MVAKEYEINRTFIDDIAFFRKIIYKIYINFFLFEENLTLSQKNALAGVLYTQKFAKDQPIVVEGDIALSYYIIKEVWLYVYHFCNK